MSEEAIRGFDFHCHVDLHPDPVAIIDRCVLEKIFVLAVTTTPKAWAQNCIWANRNHYVYAAAGLHPELVGERYAEINLLEHQIHESPFIGEVGLDGSSRHRASYQRQKDVFIRILNAAQKAGKRVLSIHSRSSAPDVISLIQRHTDPQQVLSILHWFSGSMRQIDEAFDVGCYFSVNRAMFDSEHGRSLIKHIPIDRLLTETDLPFTKVEKRNSLPGDVATTAALLANVYEIPASLMNSRLRTNAQRVLRFAGLEI